MACERTMVLGLTMVWLTAMAVTGQEAAPKPGDVVFESNLDTPEAQQAWSEAPFAEWVEGHEGTTSLKVTVPADQAAGGHMIRMPLDLERYRGCRLALECMAKAEGVTEPPQTYLGVKFMLHYTSEEAGAYWHNQDNVFGTFDWKKLSFTSPIAGDATGGELNLGLQECSGTVWFDAIKVTVY